MEIAFEVEGYPPAKKEAPSLFAYGHRHATRVTALLHAARLAAGDSEGSAPRPSGLELTVACPEDRTRSDATNYVGGVSDVLEDRAWRGTLDELGDRAASSPSRSAERSTSA